MKSVHDLDATQGTVQLRRATHGRPDASTLIHHPRPSPSDPNDPLRWPRARKHACFASICAFVFLTNFGVSALAPALPSIAAELDVSDARAAGLIIWPLLLFGAGNFGWVPLAQTVGKRPVFIVASAIYAAAQGWGAAAQSFQPLFNSVMLATAMGSATEALGAAMVNDLYFLHERSSKMGIYIVCISTGNSVGPLICGFMAETVGWRWYKVLAAILVGLNCLFVLFFVPETRYLERDLSHEGDNLYEPSTLSLDTGTDTAVNGSLTTDKPDKPDEKYSMHVAPDASDTPTPTSPAQQKPKQTYLQSLSLWPGLPPHTTPLTIAQSCIRPLPLIVFPSIIYATLAYGVSLAWVVSMNTLLPFTLQSAPYSWPISTTGLLNIGGIIGNVAGALLGGPAVDAYADRAARRAHGVFRPEMRLVLLVVPVLVVPAGLLAVGYGVAERLQWASFAVGFGMVSFALTTAPAIGMTYVSDALQPIQSDALLLVNALKNILAFGLSYAIVPWANAQGYVNLYGTQAGLYVAVVGGGGLALWMFGARVRRVTGRWRVVV